MCVILFFSVFSFRVNSNWGLIKRLMAHSDRAKSHSCHPVPLGCSHNLGTHYALDHITNFSLITKTHLHFNWPALHHFFGEQKRQNPYSLCLLVWNMGGFMSVKTKFRVPPLEASKRQLSLSSSLNHNFLCVRWARHRCQGGSRAGKWGRAALAEARDANEGENSAGWLEEGGMGVLVDAILRPEPALFIFSISFIFSDGVLPPSPKQGSRIRKKHTMRFFFFSPKAMLVFEFTLHIL